MPTYQYECNDCRDGLEVQQSFTDDALTICPSCGGRLRKVFNAVGVVFKGSGFYRNDSRASAQNGEKSAGDEGDTKKDKPSTSDSSGSSAKDSAKTPSSTSGSAA